MAEKFLDRVYKASDAAGTRALYDAWAASYEDEVDGEGYITPSRCAQALARHLSDKSAPILDFGCGTGLSGVALGQAGYSLLDGVDLSAEMLNGARTKGIYRTLTQIEAGAPLPCAPGDYVAISAIGVIGAGAAPISAFDLIMDALAPGGLMLLSFNDHALADPVHEGKLRQYTDEKRARILFQEYGPHLPGLDLNSNVYVIEKL